MNIASKKEFIARTIYHHSKRTSEYVTLLVYKDSLGIYELRDDRESEHDFLAGTEDYIFEEWGKRNRQVFDDGFQQDNRMGYEKWQRFIT